MPAPIDWNRVGRVRPFDVGDRVTWEQQDGCIQRGEVIELHDRSYLVRWSNGDETAHLDEDVSIDPE